MDLPRRDFLLASVAATARAFAPARLTVPVHRVMNARARCTPAQYRRFWWRIWPEAVRTFANGGILLETSDDTGDIKTTAADRPILVGVRPGVLNLVLTDHIPMRWDVGQGLAGVTTIYYGYHVSMIAIENAHGHQVPYLSVNTCVHEILHALLGDIFVTHPGWFESANREFRTDAFATGLWLFHNGELTRRLAAEYLARLRTAPAG